MGWVCMGTGTDETRERDIDDFTVSWVPLEGVLQHKLDPEGSRRGIFCPALILLPPEPLVTQPTSPAFRQRAPLNSC